MALPGIATEGSTANMALVVVLLLLLPVVVVGSPKDRL
jgi:hypothetical protein